MARFTVILMLLFSSSAAANNLYLVGQSGSYSGMFTLGLGYERLNTSHEVTVGYTPKRVGGEDLYSASIKNTIHPDSCVLVFSKCVRAYAGLNVIFSLFDSDTFIKQPKQYPSKYYPANGVRLAALAGLDFLMFGGQSFYVELSSLDLYLENWVRSDYKMSIQSVTTYGIGYKIIL